MLIREEAAPPWGVVVWPAKPVIGFEVVASVCEGVAVAAATEVVMVALGLKGFCAPQGWSALFMISAALLRVVITGRTGRSLHRCYHRCTP